MKDLETMICELTNDELGTISGGEEVVVIVLVNGVYIQKTIFK